MYMLCVNRIKKFNEKNSCDTFILQAFATKNTCIYFFKWAHTIKAK